MKRGEIPRWQTLWIRKILPPRGEIGPEPGRRIRNEYRILWRPLRPHRPSPRASHQPRQARWTQTPAQLIQQMSKNLVDPQKKWQGGSNKSLRIRNREESKQELMGIHKRMELTSSVSPKGRTPERGWRTEVWALPRPLATASAVRPASPARPGTSRTACASFAWR